MCGVWVCGVCVCVSYMKVGNFMSLPVNPWHMYCYEVRYEQRHSHWNMITQEGAGGWKEQSNCNKIGTRCEDWRKVKIWGEGAGKKICG